MSTPKTIINCLVSGDPPSAMFLVRISPGDQVAVLKESVEAHAQIPSRFVTLFKVSLAPEDPLLRAPAPRTVPGAEELSSPWKPISNFFTDTLLHDGIDVLVVSQEASLDSEKCVPPLEETIDEKGSID
ncbi:hypothetical protein EYR40_002507 [Pleurotus pulmonarius]|nr:hypothetical protein EYR40_002507 [Pleurotus pulmonarius]